MMMEREIETAEALRELARDFGSAAATYRAHHLHGPARHAEARSQLVIETLAAKAPRDDRRAA